jgi:hypothetical protein
MSQKGNFALIPLAVDLPEIVFDYFPREIAKNSIANWESQNVTIGVKPLFYANREPMRLTVDELLIDKTDTNESIRPELDALQALQEEWINARSDNGALATHGNRNFPDLGRPPLLLVIYGNFQGRFVLTELTIKEVLFTPDGNPLRAFVSLTLLEVQQRERTRVRFRDPFDEPEHLPQSAPSSLTRSRRTT